MIEDIIALLYFFEDKVPDKNSNKAVLELAENKAKWNNAHDLFSNLRSKNLKAIKNKENVSECQYCFEEVCTQSIYNLTQPSDPFDPDSPYWVIKTALALAKALSLPIEEIVNIVAPNK